MKLYMVDAVVSFVVIAKDEREALEVAEKYKHEALRDNPIDIDVVCRVETEGDLTQRGWNSNCFPYGCDTRLHDLMPPNVRINTSP